MKRKAFYSALLLLAISIALALNGCDVESPREDYGPPTVDVTGTWLGSLVTGDMTGDFNFVMTQTIDKVEGINTRLGRFTGKVSGNVFTIDGTDLLAYVSGDEMEGVYTGPEGNTVEFYAERTGGPAVAEVRVTSISPDSAPRGSMLSVSIYGTGFRDGADVQFSGGNITVYSVTYISSEILTAGVSIGDVADTTARNVTVENPDGRSATLTGGFTVTE